MPRVRRAPGPALPAQQPRNFFLISSLPLPKLQESPSRYTYRQTGSQETRSPLLKPWEKVPGASLPTLSFYRIPFSTSHLCAQQSLFLADQLADQQGTRRPPESSGNLLATQRPMFMSLAISSLRAGSSERACS